jgi:hypothetical protein
MEGMRVPDPAPAVEGHHNGELRYLFAMCNDLLRTIRPPESAAGRIEMYRHLDEAMDALGVIRTRLEVAAVLGNVPGVTSGQGSSPLASAAVDRFVRAMIVIARRDT